MKGYTSENIRNVALLGHGGCGKTTFLEAALLETGVIKKAGKVEDGNTVSDYDKMEKEKGFSINTSIVPVEWKDTKLNFIDTPGYFDYVGEVNAAMRAAEAAVIMVDAGSGVQVGTEKAWKACERYNMPRMVVINKRDRDEFDFDTTLGQLKEKFGDALVPITLPLEDVDDDLMEAIASADEDLMEKFFEGEEFTKEEIQTGMVKGISEGTIVPVCTTLFQMGQSVAGILDMVQELTPNPLQHAPYEGTDDAGETVERECSVDGAPAAFVFKTIADPFVGKISIMKVVSGKLENGQDMYNDRAGKTERLAKVVCMRGKEQNEVGAIAAGDICAVAKLQYTETGDTLCDKGSQIKFPPVDFASPTYYVAVEADDKNDEEKMGTGLNRLKEEDPSFTVERNAETHQTLLGGQGDMQLNIVMAKLKDRFGVNVHTVPQKIAYRETIKGNSDVQGKHKKQSGGAGQYGDVHIRFSPSQEDGLEFSEELFGGSVPKNYVPAVEKGLLECMEKGPLAGCKCVNIKAVLYDGSYHEVDSNEVSFKLAASLAFKKGIVEANPCLLEPIMHMDIYVPDDYMGAVMGDMNKRRGSILGMEPQANGEQKLMAEAPQAELFDYALGLRSMTQGRGRFEMHFERYQEVPKQMADKIIAAHAEEEK
ncbi:translation factor GTPase family protein [Eubacterium sp. AB3007]|uniref:elongation factor G n=1 Tax=Eubacterium sp. AB3007 TaxID=1392487 RepID=UPI000489D0C3|nr:elongation factor G [Eubacterium sp. AB3007]